jgi:hypothetical protein
MKNGNHPLESAGVLAGFPHIDFVVTDDFQQALMDREFDDGSRKEFTDSVKYALAVDFDGQTISASGMRTRQYVSERQPGWPLLHVYVWAESPTRIHLCDVREP